MRRSKFSESLDLIRGSEPLLRDVKGKIKAQLAMIECYIMIEQHRNLVREMDELSRLNFHQRKQPIMSRKWQKIDITAQLYIN